MEWIKSFIIHEDIILWASLQNEELVYVSFDSLKQGYEC